MRFKITRLDFSKDPSFDPDHNIEYEYTHPYIVEYKKHWWNKWKYIIDNETNCPTLFYGVVNLLVLKQYV